MNQPFEFVPLSIKGVILIKPIIKVDERGHFIKVFSSVAFQHFGITLQWKQVNDSFTNVKGSFRGVHFQIPPHADYKLIRCLKGSIVDYGIDLRKGSSTLFQNIQVELSEQNGYMLLLPPLVGHAFQSLEDSCIMSYLHTEEYVPSCDFGVRYNDPLINLKLELPISSMSIRDKNFPILSKNFNGI